MLISGSPLIYGNNYTFRVRPLGGHGVALAYPTIVEPQFKTVSKRIFLSDF
jgi:hypothetical protein